MKHQKRTKELLERYRETMSEQQIQCPNDIQRAITYIHDHCFNEELNIQRLKEACNINRKSFSARFKRFINKYPKEYITHHRIKAGKILLQKTDASVTLIALELGFSSNSSFCKAFKNKEALQPSEWRAKNSK